MKHHIKRVIKAAVKHARKLFGLKKPKYSKGGVVHATGASMYRLEAGEEVIANPRRSRRV